MFSEMPRYSKVQEVQQVQQVQAGRQWSTLSRISRLTQKVREAPAAQKRRPVLVCHSLEYPVNLAPQGGLVHRALTPLWVPQALVFRRYLLAPATLPPPRLPSLL